MKNTVINAPYGYVLYYKVTGRSHGVIINGARRVSKESNAFSDAKLLFKEKRPRLNADDMFSFYTLPVDSEDFVCDWDKSKRHGWDGKLDYPLLNGESTLEQ